MRDPPDEAVDRRRTGAVHPEPDEVRRALADAERRADRLQKILTRCEGGLAYACRNAGSDDSGPAEELVTRIADAVGRIRLSCRDARAAQEAAEQRADEAVTTTQAMWEMYEALEGVLRSTCGGHLGDCDCPGCDWLGQVRPPQAPIPQELPDAGAYLRAPVVVVVHPCRPGRHPHVRVWTPRAAPQATTRVHRGGDE
jgi:hypothetical protein